MSAPDDLLARHSLLVGSTGSGKTVLSLHLLQEQLRAGCSAVVLCAKQDEVDATLAICEEIGLPPDGVFLFDPRFRRQPGWNPLTADDPTQVANDLLAVFKADAGASWGRRMEDLLMNALLLLAEHKLSLWELQRFLTRPGYRQAVLELPVQSEAALEALEFFQEEFSLLSAAQQAEHAGPISNKLRQVARNPFLRTVLCPARESFSMGRLWQRQSVLIVYLDQFVMGKPVARLFGGMVAHHLVSAALKTPRNQRPVILAIDEVGFVGPYLGEYLEELAGRGRGRVRLLLACQVFSQLPETLRDLLTSMCQVQGYFQLRGAGAAAVASSLAIRSDLRVRSARVEASGWDWRSVRVTDGYGEPFDVTPATWRVTKGYAAHFQDPIDALNQLCAVTGLVRLYIGGKPLSQALKGLTAQQIQLGGYRPVRVRLYLPQVHLARVEKDSRADLERNWSRVLEELDPGYCVMTLGGKVSGTVQVLNLPARTVSPDYVESVVAANGQTLEQVQGIRKSRNNAARALVDQYPSRPVSKPRRGLPAAPPVAVVEVEEDGSLS